MGWISDSAVLAALIAGVVGLLLKIADMASAARTRRDEALNRAVQMHLDAQAEAIRQNDRRVAAEKREDIERDERRRLAAVAEERDIEIARLRRQVGLLETKRAEAETRAEMGRHIAARAGPWLAELARRERVADERAIETGHVACEVEARRLVTEIARLRGRIEELREREQARETGRMEAIEREGGDD